MKNIKKFIVVATAIGVLGVAGTVYAATLKTPAEITAEVTGQSVEAVTEQRAETGKTYGTIAEEAGKLDEFQAEILEQKKTVLDEEVASGDLTPEQADTIYENIENNQATCYGQGGYGMMGGGYGMGGRGGCGLGGGYGRGQGAGFRTQGAGLTAPAAIQ